MSKRLKHVTNEELNNKLFHYKDIKSTYYKEKTLKLIREDI